ncbi:MAG: hypothetical protein LH473_06605 [Chitinophagales bacterium]|nr:hypothetical protein [Chitinophagales bacterium]
MAERKNLFLVCKEAIHNIIKYAEATEVKISIEKNEGRLKMIIKDNGKGFAMNRKVYNGNGIKNMRARVESIKGTFSIKSDEMKGTTVMILWISIRESVSTL